MDLLNIIKNQQDIIYAKYDLKLEDFFPDKESPEYYAHSFTIKGKNGLFRIAKKTPTKLGYFVTLWRRDSNNIIAPYDISNNIDFVVIAICDNDKLGEFIFPKAVLLKNNIFSSNDKNGKRGFRVYAPWDRASNIQAKKTQNWQSQFFVDLTSINSESISKIQNLYSL